MINILVVEPNDILREKVSGILSRMKNVRMVTQISSCDELVHAAMTTAPDMIFIDLKLALIGKHHIAEIRESHPDVEFHIMAEHDSGPYRIAAACIVPQRLVIKERIEDEIEGILSAAGTVVKRASVSERAERV